MGHDSTKGEEEVEEVLRKKVMVEEVVRRWKRVHSEQVFGLLAAEVAGEQLKGFVDLEGVVVVEGLEKVVLAHLEFSEEAAAELRRREVLNAHGKCPLEADVGKTVDDCGPEVAVERQMAFAPLGKEVARRILASDLLPHPPAFWEA